MHPGVAARADVKDVQHDIDQMLEKVGWSWLQACSDRGSRFLAYSRVGGTTRRRVACCGRWCGRGRRSIGSEKRHRGKREGDLRDEQKSQALDHRAANNELLALSQSSG